ncbi:MAG: aminopeptidase N [Gammaproteobacteria bacterium]|jgi:aminopeptidase N
MRETSPHSRIYLKDYTPPPYLIDDVDLRFELGEDETLVHARLSLRRNPDHPAPGDKLRLDGEGLSLRAIAVNGQALPETAYHLDAHGLELIDPPESFVLETTAATRPQDNTALEGLYKSSGNFCTQCEAEGFRHITWYLDRPDVLARFKTSIVAERARYPVLLSNGNLIEQGETDDGRHYVVWQDPFPKPGYLFALVAGDLGCHEDRYATASGREVALRIYVQHHNLDKCDHAMDSLKKAMRWDEQTFGLEYDLDIYMIVAVDDFNMGAMENKGLNVFNSKFVLASPETATDADYLAIEGVIGHEYFHNWTGNRVTCRDWFQLSLKEGLTVFRDQEFSADMNSRAVKRIEDVRLLRDVQFAEDAGPMAHAVRPDSYMEINNFYTVTVYEKGAEVVRLYQTLLGRDGFRRGLEHYLRSHDGQAATTDDFRQAMASANGVDLEPMKLWYSQAGTPRVKVEQAWDPAAQTCTLHVSQSIPDTPGQTGKQPQLIPLAVGLLDGAGREIPLQLEGEEAPVGGSRVLRLTEKSQSFTFVNVPERPVPSLLRGFSAPVCLEYPYTEAERAFLMAHDTDEFNRWEAGHQLATRTLLELAADYSRGDAIGLAPEFIDAYAQLLSDQDADPALIAEALRLPSVSYLIDQMDSADPEALHATRRFVRHTLAQSLREVMLERYHAGVDEHYSKSPEAIARRSLKNVCLGYLLELREADLCDLAVEQARAADNMTDVLGALRGVNDIDCEQRDQALTDFETRWRDDSLVLDKWFSLQATSAIPGALERVRALMDHPCFSIRNPNRVRALIGSFVAANPLHFHAPDGSGYRFLAEQVAELDKLNPQVAARLAKQFSRWQRFEPGRSGHMRTALESLAAREGLSKDVYEVVTLSLGSSD